MLRRAVSRRGGAEQADDTHTQHTAKISPLYKYWQNCWYFCYKKMCSHTLTTTFHWMPANLKLCYALHGPSLVFVNIVSDMRGCVQLFCDAETATIIQGCQILSMWIFRQPQTEFRNICLKVSFLILSPHFHKMPQSLSNQKGFSKKKSYQTPPKSDLH